MPRTPKTPTTSVGPPILRVETNGSLFSEIKSGLRRKSEAIGLRAASLADTVMPTPKSKARLARYTSVENLNNARLVVDVRSLLSSMTLIRAARDGLLDVVEAHIQSQTARLEDVDEDGFTATHHAARYNRFDVLKCLIEAGAEMQARGGPEEISPLHLASRYNSIDAVQYLLSIGALVNATDIKGKTPLHYATRRGNDTVTKMLLSVSSCYVDAQDHDKTTSLHMASIQGNPDICELLITRGADVTAKDINDMTPLMWAAIEGHNRVIKLLLKTASKHSTGDRSYVRLGDNEGNTALHLAVQNGKLMTCEILLEQMADVNGQKNNLATPLHIAATHGFVSIAEVLISYGADVNRPDLDHMTPTHNRRRNLFMIYATGLHCTIVWTC